MVETGINRKIKNVLWVVILGAIGSGLWDLFLKSLVYRMGNLFVNLALYFNHGYLDHIYYRVGRGFELEIFPALVIILTIMLSPIWLLAIIQRYYSPKRNREEKEPSGIQKLLLYIFATKARMYFFVILLTIPITIMYADALIIGISVKKANDYINQNLEIIKPYVDDHEYYLIRSKFRQIDNKQKLQEVLDTIKQIESKNNIVIPSLNLYGINN